MPSNSLLGETQVDSEGANDDQQDGDVSSDDTVQCELCTFAVTGQKTAFQSIYICHTCSRTELSTSNTALGCEEKEVGDNAPLNSACVCQSCAFACHHDEGHDIEYVGVGECYCDCEAKFGNCCLGEVSRKVAKENGIIKMDSIHDREEMYVHIEINTNQVGVDGNNGKEEAKVDISPFPYVFGVYSIPQLIRNQNFNCQQLIRQCMVLVKYTKETHWIPSSTSLGELCGLELLAYAVFQHHFKAFHLDNLVHRDDGSTGAEWWVQVKPLKNRTMSTDPANSKSTSNVDEGVNLHYDKDETLAEIFGLGSFPILSTVTYLSGNCTQPTINSNSNLISQAPTLIFPHMYNQGEDHSINKMIVSHPKKGKHIVFDGRLLHGAPAHPKLRKPMDSFMASAAYSNDVKDKGVDDIDNFRVTFLVNIWIGNKPTGVCPLDPEIRSSIMKTASASSKDIEMFQESIISDYPTKPPFMRKEAVHSHRVEKRDIDTEIDSMIRLPFDSSDDQEELTPSEDSFVDVNGSDSSANIEEDDLFLCMYPPGSSCVLDNDTVHYEFHDELKAFLNRTNDE